MKNLLELQIVEAIQKANSLFMRSHLTDASAAYQTAYQIFYENVAYNQSIRKNYESILFSLKGAIFEEMGQEEQALSNFNQALILTPNHLVTLLRRGKVHMKKRMFIEAIDDLSKASLEFPESEEIGNITEKLKIEILKVEDQTERGKLLEYFQKSLSRQFQKDREEQMFDDESRMSFSHLKQIDKESTEKQFRRKSTRAYSQLFLANQQLYPPESIKIKGRKGSLMPQIIQKTKKMRKTYSNQSSNSCETLNRPLSKFNSSLIHNSNFKNTDDSKQKKLKELQDVLSKRNSEVKFSEDLQDEPLQIQKKKGKRKSCMRLSSMSQSMNKLGFISLRGKRSSFGDLKCIDRKIEKNFDSSQKQLSSKEEEKASGDDSDNNEKHEHNIFEREVSGKDILKCLNNLTKLSSDAKTDGIVKKKSILRKNSVADSASSRKSVTFKIDPHR